MTGAASCQAAKAAPAATDSPIAQASARPEPRGWAVRSMRSEARSDVRCSFIRAPSAVRLLEDLGDDACADGTAALADGEALPLLEGDGRDEVDGDLRVVARHHHLGALGQG